MIAYALPRAVRSSCSTSTVIGPAIAATSSSATHARSSHQRRRSSSKASSSSSSCPPGGQRPSDQAASNASQSSLERSQRGLSRRKNTVEPEVAKGRESKPSKILAAPSSQHLTSADISISKFFSAHRPISITSTFPSPTSTEQFNAIFTSRVKHADVIYTISNTISTLEGKEESDLRREILNSSASHATSKPAQADTKIPSLDEMLKQFRPFNVPPPPVPFDDIEQSQGQEGQEQVGASGHNVEATRLSSTQGTRTSLPGILARYIRAMSPGIQRVFAQLMSTKGPRTQRLWVISVRRQRRLKMKKHKYKKRMRATRNIRKREGRL